MSGYIGTQPVPQATQTRDAFTCTAGQTSFATSGYTPSFLDVYLNGVKLAAADYTASNGSDVVLASGAALDDILEVVAYTSFEVVTDTVTNAGTVLNLDRTGLDGTILDLKKDGTTVGSVGAGAGGFLTIGSPAGTPVYATFANGSLKPTTSLGFNSDGGGDLGNVSARWKDLYLSGGVYLGGTGSANKLDDYEEGTWTPVIRGSGGDPSVTYTTANTGGIYTKIGDTVFVSFEVRWSAITGGGGSASISGLPFTRSGTNTPDGDRSTFDFYNVTVPSGGISPICSAATTQTFLNLSFNRSGTTTTSLPVGNLINTNPGFIRASLVYKV